MPYAEGGAIYNATNFSVEYDVAANSTMMATRVSFMTCPSEVYQGGAVTDNGYFYPTSYGWNMGDWFLYGGYSGSSRIAGMQTRGMFAPNFSRTIASITDGTSNTLFAAEVKTYTLQLRNCGTPGSPPSGMSPTSFPMTVAAGVAYIQANQSACTQKAVSHARWNDGAVAYSGMSTALTPNTRTGIAANVSYSSTILTQKNNPAGVTYVNGIQDADWVSVDENNGGPTFGTVTARSFHPGGVNCLFADGSVHFLKDSVNILSWCALGSVNGGEVLSSDSF